MTYNSAVSDLNTLHQHGLYGVQVSQGHFIPLQGLDWFCSQLSRLFSDPTQQVLDRLQGCIREITTQHALVESKWDNEELEVAYRSMGLFQGWNQSARKEHQFDYRITIDNSRFPGTFFTCYRLTDPDGPLIVSPQPPMETDGSLVVTRKGIAGTLKVGDELLSCHEVAVDKMSQKLCNDSAIGYQFVRNCLYPVGSEQYDVKWDGGELISEDEGAHLLSIYERFERKVDWERGDLMLLHNGLMMHGKQIHEGPRDIRVAMA
ncbi:MAG: hypothetical protein AB7F31_02450 [Parachlamydiales bacterium]